MSRSERRDVAWFTPFSPFGAINEELHGSRSWVPLRPCDMYLYVAMPWRTANNLHTMFLFFSIKVCNSAFFWFSDHIQTTVYNHDNQCARGATRYNYNFRWSRTSIVMIFADVLFFSHCFHVSFNRRHNIKYLRWPHSMKCERLGKKKKIKWRYIQSNATFTS